MESFYYVSGRVPNTSYDGQQDGHSLCSESHAPLSHGDTWRVMKKLRVPRKEEACLLYVRKELASEKNFSKEMMHELSDKEWVPADWRCRGREGHGEMFLSWEQSSSTQKKAPPDNTMVMACRCPGRCTVTGGPEIQRPNEKTLGLHVGSLTCILSATRSHWKV